MQAQSSVLITGWPFEDRRLRRSGERSVALRYQLEHSRERGGLEAMVLADVDGLVIAGSGDRAICAELAAVAPLTARSIWMMPLPPLLVGAEVDIRRLSVYGQQLFMCCVGGGPAREVLFRNAIAGVERILQSN
jgi:hypothetical protein